MVRNRQARRADCGTATPRRTRRGAPVSLLPRRLALRLALVLLLVLACGSALFVTTLRARLQEVTAPQLARNISAGVVGVRAALTALPPAQRDDWIRQLNAVDGDVHLEALPALPPEAVTGRPMYHRIEAELQRLTGADTRVTFERAARQRMRIDFRVGDGYYRLSVATALSWASLLPELWLFLAMGLAVAAAVLIVLLQVNRPLRRGAESLARSVSELAEIEMPASAPQEFRVFAERFNALAQRLRAQDRERGLILAGVSHDLRAPLTRIRMRAELIDDRVAAESLARDVESMRHIIDQFLDYQKAGASVHARRVDVGEVAHGVVERHRELGRTVLLSEDGTLTVTATPEMIERILDNLIDNALAYGAAPVEVRVEHGPSGGLLQVRDHGAGIPPRELQRLLRPFERLDEARSEQGHCGLGLPIVERLVQQIGGRLTLSNPPDGGLQASMRF